MTDNIKFTGRANFSRRSVTGLDDYIVLTVTDMASRNTVIEMRIDAKDFAGMVFGPIDVAPNTIVEIREIDCIGTRLESKEEFVPDTGAGELACLTPFEVDGWTARGGCFGNHRRWVARDGVKGYRVAFYRHVRPDGSPVL